MADIALKKCHILLFSNLLLRSGNSRELVGNALFLHLFVKFKRLHKSG
jgi:hypothetical protein